MLIVTTDDQDFNDLLDAANTSRLVGSCKKEGTVQYIKANSRLVMILQDDTPDKIAIKPARNEAEAEQIALRILEMEELRGCEVNRT